jgi:hypothetical protein
MKRVTILCAIACILWPFRALAAASNPTAPFVPDEHTLLLYHFDEGQGTAAKDSSGRGCDGEIRGAQWAEGRFGKALRFDGVDESVFRQSLPAVQGLKRLTVECWFKQDNPEGRQFLVDQDVVFHFDLSDGQGTSLSLYNQGSQVANAQGLRHHQIGAGLGVVPFGKWHHLAVTFDGRQVSFFLDGVLKGRSPGATDFLLGVPSRGLWVGCYVGSDYWFNGRIDEVRVSDCVRYDPENRLQLGQKTFEMPSKPAVAKQVRKPLATGTARLSLTLKRLYGGNSTGWVSLKSLARPAATVGRFDLSKAADGAESRLELDVSDEWAGEGAYIVGLVPEGGGDFAVTEAALSAGGNIQAKWSGNVRSRRTFEPPVLVPLRVGTPPTQEPSRVVLLPEAADRISGNLDVEPGNSGDPPYAFGEGTLEFWIDVPREQAYRAYLRYASPGLRPCDLVIDGVDLHPYHMSARNRSLSPALRDALWEYQGTTVLSAGPHGIRLQDVLPEVVALRLEPTTSAPALSVPWRRYAVPDGYFLGQAETWQVENLLGRPENAWIGLDKTNAPSLRFSATLANVDPAGVFAGDCVRFTHRGTWDLEPFGRLRFRFRGEGTGHVVSLWAVDAKGDEKVLWRARDLKAGVHDVSVPVSFEGNDVFDAAHVAAICLELDEGNVSADRVNHFAGAIVGPMFDRRDAIAPPQGYLDALAKARLAMDRVLKTVGEKPAPLVARGFRPWTKPVVPEEHPLYAKTEPKPVTRKTLGYDLHCTGARDISAHALDQFHKFYDFGDVCWPHIGICPQRSAFAKEEDYRAALREMEKRLEDVRRRGLLVFDIWGYVPLEPQYPAKIAPEHHEILMRVFGDRFLGYDNGEQDGRYIGSYASGGKHTNRKEGWDDFVRWDKRVCDDSMNYMNATGSLNFSHYYGERGCRLLGLETAQGLPSDTLMFAFLRGAGRQYGRLLTQATSIWSRFGYNMYHGRKTEGAGGYGYGPNKGCSLSLHKRLFFSSYLGGHSIVGTETSQFTADVLPSGAPELSPLGKQHVELRDWFRKHPERGVMVTPVAFMLDFYNGWNMPRHLYRGDTYKIWGKFPYEKGDHLADGLFRMIWPGYEDCSYLRNERGFLTPTPFGDIFDVITNRCHPSILKQYRCVMLVGDVEMTPDVISGLVDFVRAGGDLVMDARSARALPQEMTGMKFGAPAKGWMSCLLPTGEAMEEQPYTYTVAEHVRATPLLVNERRHPLVAVNPVGHGRVIVGTVDHWMTDRVTYRVPQIVNMDPPYLLLRGIRALLESYFDSFNPVEIAPKGLGITTCCFDGDPKRLLVGLMNHNLFADWKGTLRMRFGQIAAVQELWRGTTLTPRDPVEFAIPAGDLLILDIRLR